MPDTSDRQQDQLLRDLDALQPGEFGVVCFTDALVLSDAIKIADSTARSDIECHFLRDNAGWYDTDVTGDEKDFLWLPEILRYLDARGGIERDPDRTSRIRFLPRA